MASKDELQSSLKEILTFSANGHLPVHLVLLEPALVLLPLMPEDNTLLFNSRESSMPVSPLKWDLTSSLFRVQEEHRRIQLWEATTLSCIITSQVT